MKLSQSKHGNLPLAGPETPHPVTAGLAGLVAGSLAVVLVEWLGQQWIGETDLPQPASITTRLHILMLAAWVLGAGLAGIVATALSGGRRRAPGLVAAGALTAVSAATLFAAPHPLWMIAGSVLLMPAAGWLGAQSRIAGVR